MNNKTAINQILLDPTKFPTKRAAYSDRTALLMAKLSKIAYTEFDKSDNSNLIYKLGKLGLELAGGAPIDRNGTQAFVAIKKENSKVNFAVICFRGTEITKLRDLITIFTISTVPIRDPNSNIDPKNAAKIIGHMHKGFHEAYQPEEGAIKGSVADDIKNRLEKYKNEDFPIYITGHSMGGALAVVATWYQSKHKLAACYTFGAPRVGSSSLLGWYKTPIYRVVNKLDIIPFLPPIGDFIRLVAILLRPLLYFKFIRTRVKWLINYPEFKHYGDIRYIPREKKGMKLLILSNIRDIERIFRNFWALIRGKLFGNIFQEFKYHEICKYEEKLYIIAKNRNPDLIYDMKDDKNE